jgi:oxaloacetate decarboxylase alpha subunit/pyruvate carboxylase subunit B
MDKLRAELAAAGLPTDDEACVLHAMFPREFAALHTKKPVSTPASSSCAPSAVGLSPEGMAGATAGRPQRFAITIEGRRSEVVVEEVA